MAGAGATFEALHHIGHDVGNVMVDGRIVRTGGPEVALELEEQGYADWKEREEVVA